MIKLKLLWNETAPKEIEVKEDIEWRFVKVNIEIAFGLPLTANDQTYCLQNDRNTEIKHDQDWSYCLQEILKQPRNISEQPNFTLLIVTKSSMLPNRKKQKQTSFDSGSSPEEPEPVNSGDILQSSANPNTPFQQSSNLFEQESLENLSGDESTIPWDLDQSISGQSVNKSVLEQPRQTEDRSQPQLQEQPTNLLQTTQNPPQTSSPIKSRFQIATDSPAKEFVPGHPITKTLDEFFEEIRQLNPDRQSRQLIDQVEPKARELYYCLYNRQSTSDPMLQICLKVARAVETSDPKVKKTPKIHQIFTVLVTLMKPETFGVLVQIATGEGKSLIGRMAAACISLFKNQPVDFVTSANNLVLREIEEAEPFYKAIKVSVGSCIGFHEKYKSKEDMDQNNDYVQKNILCGTVHEFSVNSLRDLLQNQRYTPPEDQQSLQRFKNKYYSDCRPDAFLILDEVDNMFIDEQNNSTRHQEPAPDGSGRQRNHRLARKP